MSDHTGEPHLPPPMQTTASGIPMPAAAGPSDVAPGLDERLGRPGEYPFTRGIHPQMYRTRPWTFRQLAGFATAADTNKRYRMLLDKGATGINGVFDYPSLRAVGSDDARAASDVGRGGVAVDVADDFDDLFTAIPLDRVSVSLVSSQPVGAAPHLAMYLAAAERRGYDRRALAGTSQNDFLMETAITIAPEALPPAASFRVECDVAEYCARELPRWNPISVTGYNYREAGADAPLELALTLAHGRAAARELIGRGLAPEVALPKISFFLDAHADFFEEIAKFRAARRMWARFVAEDLGVTDPAAQKFRFHVQTSGVTMTARLPHLNIARSAIQALSAVLGGTQSLHVDAYDEALSIPSEHAAFIALHTQHVLLWETGVAGSADPLGGSYLVEHLTDAMEERVGALVDRIEGLGGLVAATEAAWVHTELSKRAFADQQKLEDGRRLVVGINAGLDDDGDGLGHVEVQPFSLPPGALEAQRRRIDAVRARRSDTAVASALDTLGSACTDGVNVMPSVLAAVAADATLGEIGTVLRDRLGRWHFPLW
ncbi:MAG: methylmalonyl-CoA mutase, N-terminal domain [Actinomycetota bacterium]|nr:methylmalonyl-CoA mutase, N-terminal domain [Actinomycetota bacterium]